MSHPPLPPPPPPPSYGGPGVPAVPPPAYLRVHLQGNMMVSLITPSVTINGYSVAARYGQNVYPVPPGHHVVAAHAQWMWRYGHAQQAVQLGPGQVADIYYAVPALTFVKGAMGFEKQRSPGLLPLVLVGSLLVLLCVLALVAVVVAG